MPYTYHPKPLKLPPGVQPQYPVEIDWSHPLSQGLVGCCTPWGEHVSGIGGWQFSSGNDHSVDNKGRALHTNSGTITSYARLPATEFAVDKMYNKASWTVASHFKQNSSTAANQAIFGLFSDDVADNEYLAGFRIDSADRPVMLWCPSGAFKGEGATTISASVGHNFIAEVNYGDENILHWVNGATEADSDLEADVGSTPTLGTPWWCIGNRNPSGSAMAPDIEFYVGYVWDRPLSNAELQSIENDPYQIFKPAVDFPVFFGASTSGTQKSTYYNRALKPLPGVQPQYPVEIDWTNPISHGITVAILGGDQKIYGRSSATKYKNYDASKFMPTVRNGARGWKPENTAASLGGIDRYIYNPSSKDYGDGMSCFVRTWNDTAPDSSTYLVGTIFGEFQFRYRVGPKLFLVPETGDNYLGSTTAVGVSGENTAAFSIRGTTADTIRGFLNGEFETETDTTALPTGKPVEDLYWTGLGGAQTDVDQSLQIGIFWDRAISDDEILSLNRDPYQIFKPAVDFPVFFSDASALSLTRISAMHFQRHYEPIAMGE